MIYVCLKMLISFNKCFYLTKILYNLYIFNENEFYFHTKKHQNYIFPATTV